jgi:WD40 repeat protein
MFYAIDGAGVVKFWETATGKRVGSFQAPAPPIRAAALGPGGRYFALGANRERVVRLYERATGRETQLAGHRDSVNTVAFSPDGVTLASGSFDGTIRFWETATSKHLASVPAHMEEASAVAFSPDGRTLASVNLRHSIKLWHLATYRELVSLEFPEAGDRLGFSPDGRHLAVTTSDNFVRLFEAPTLETMDRLDPAE